MMPGNDEQKLDALFRAYRDVCDAPEAGVNFMPHLWERIDARRRSTSAFGRWARHLVAGAVAASLALGALLVLPATQQNPYYLETYVDALEQGNAHPDQAEIEPAHLDLNATGGVAEEL